MWREKKKVCFQGLACILIHPSPKTSILSEPGGVTAYLFPCKVAAKWTCPTVLQPLNSILVNLSSSVPA